MKESIDGRDGYKRVFDLTVIIIAYVSLFPLWLIVWVMAPFAIWLEDGGPVFYAQERVGQGGKPFRVLKFRTMVRDAESHTGQVWAAEDDPRLTRIGKILRRLHLDEIPQVINIIKGEMSLVGPRPERPALAEQFNREVAGFSERLRVRPGIAGLAQVRGSYWTDPVYKLKYDNQYIETMSPWLDLKLLFLPSGWPSSVSFMARTLPLRMTALSKIKPDGSAWANGNRRQASTAGHSLHHHPDLEFRTAHRSVSGLA